MDPSCDKIQIQIRITVNVIKYIVDKLNHFIILKNISHVFEFR